jgi:hypothetical protein
LIGVLPREDDVHWGGPIFAALVILLAVPFAMPHLKAADSPVRAGGAKGVVSVVIVSLVLLVVINFSRLIGGFERFALFWTLNIVLAAVFWIALLRLSWTERRQRPR